MCGIVGYVGQGQRNAVDVLILTGEVTINENHTVQKPVYLLEVKGGVFVPLRMYR